MKVMLAGTARPVRWVGNLFERAGRWTGHQVRRWPVPALVVGSVVLLVGYFVLLWRAPRLIVGDRLDLLSVAERVSAEYNARVLVVSGAGAIVVLIGLAYTARTFALNRRGQVTDRFSKALERLGSAEMYVRLGGVHALEHVMADSTDHHADCVEVLVAFIRARAPRAPRPEYEEPVDHGQWLHPPTDHLTPTPTPPDLPREPDPDVQAALTALGRRPHRPDHERGSLDLSKLHLCGVHLAGANLHHANLTHANLTSANLNSANLDNANLDKANLTSANLECASLNGTQMTYATLDHARMRRADLTGATLRRASLIRAELGLANLTRAVLHRADLHSAILFGAIFSATNLKRADLTGAHLISKRMVRNADSTLSLALTHTTLTGAEGLDTARGPKGVVGELAQRPDAPPV